MSEAPCPICHVNHPDGKHVSLDQMEKNYILKVYESTERNVVRTAKILDIARSGLYRKLDLYGIKPRVFGTPYR